MKDRLAAIVPWLLVVGLVALCLGLAMLWNQYVYDDWTCAFSQCRRLKP